MILDDSQVGVSYHISILFQDSELDAGNFNRKQNASSDTRNTCADDGDLIK